MSKRLSAMERENERRKDEKRKQDDFFERVRGITTRAALESFLARTPSPSDSARQYWRRLEEFMANPPSPNGDEDDELRAFRLMDERIKAPLPPPMPPPEDSDETKVQKELLADLVRRTGLITPK